MLHQWSSLLGYRKLTKLCFVTYICVLLPPIWGKRSHEEIVFAALEQTEKMCIRKNKFIKAQPAFFDEGSANQYKNIKNIASKMLKKLKKDGISVEETDGGIEKWVKDLEKDDYAMLKKILFKRLKLSLVESLELRLFVTILKEQIEEQEALDSTHPFWKAEFKTKASHGSLIDYWFPFVENNRLGRLDEEHPRFDESASDEIVVRLQKKEKLLVEIPQGTITNYIKTKEYSKDGKNTRHIFVRHFNNENESDANIKASDYRYTAKFLTKEYRFGLNTRMMIHLLYYPDAFHEFFKLRIGDLLSLHEEEKKAFQELAKKPKQFPKNRQFEKMYLEIREVLFRRLKFRLAQISIIDDLLESHKNESIEKILGVNTSLRQREKTFANCFLELKLYDELMSEVMKGNVNSKVGSEHGFWHHMAIMDSFQSDAAFLASISNRWSDDFRTRVQRRYAIYRLQKLIDQGKIGGVKIKIGPLGKFSILDIISPSKLGFDTKFLAQLDRKIEPKIDGKNVETIEYSDIINIYLEKPSKNAYFVLMALGAGAFLARDKIKWSDEKPKRKVKKKEKRSAEASEEDITEKKSSSA